MPDDRAPVDLPILTMARLEADLAPALDSPGCCVVLDAAPPETMMAIADELAVFADPATFQSIAMHPAVMAAGDQILGFASSWRFSAAE